MTLLSIGYGRTLFTESDPERARLASCAQALGTVHHIVFAKRSDGLVPQKVGDALFLYPTNARTRVGMFIAALRIGHRLLREEPDALVTGQDPLAAGFVAWMLARSHGRALVLQEHGDIFSGDYWRSERAAHRIWYPLARFLLRRADKVRVVSKRVAAHVAALGISEERIRLLPVFTDVAALEGRDVKESLRTQYPHATPLVLSVARFVPQKNLSLLLRAFRTLRALQTNAKLILVGRGPLEAELRAEAKALGLADAVAFLPWAADVASFMKTADIYALSSNYEGWARVLPEAMACGLPAVTTDVGCAGEVFLHERHGLVVPVGDEVGFAEALKTLAANQHMRQSQGARGKEDVRTHGGDTTTYAQAWAAVYSDVSVAS